MWRSLGRLLLHWVLTGEEDIVKNKITWKPKKWFSVCFIDLTLYLLYLWNTKFFNFNVLKAFLIIFVKWSLGTKRNFIYSIILYGWKINFPCEFYVVNIFRIVKWVLTNFSIFMDNDTFFRNIILERNKEL